VITVTLAALAAATLVAFLAASWIFGLYTIEPAAGVDPHVFHEVGTLLTRVFLIQIFFYGATGLATALLNARRRFFAAAWCPILSNIVVIFTLLSLPSPGETSWTLEDVLTNNRVRWTLGIGETAGIAMMAIVLLPAIKRAGVNYRPRLAFDHPAVKQLLRLSGWTLGYVIANQVTVVVVRNLADPGSGDARAYFNAYTFFVLPHGLLAVSLATTFAPEMARAVTRRDKRSFCRQVSLGTRLVAMLTLPAGVLIFVLRRAIVGALLEHGAFTAADADNAARALGGFALGLVGFSVYLFVLRGFYAHQDTRTPFVINVAQNAINIGLAFALVGAFDILGLAAALAISYLVCAVWALQVMAYKVPGFPLRQVLGSLWRMVVAVAIAGEVTWLLVRHVGATSGSGAFARIAIGAVIGLAAYTCLLALLRAPELAALRARLPGLPSRRPTGAA
jgi:putative peptidoglycan lipid II flippase